MPEVATGAPTLVSVDPSTLGRIFSVLGRAVDQKGDVPAETHYSIHRAARPYTEQTTQVEIIETGVKVIDLIAPFTKDGKPHLFGGARIGKTV